MIDKLAFIDIRKICTLLSLQKKNEYFRSRISKAINKPRSLFRVVHSLLGLQKLKILPDALNDHVLAENFSLYFKNKITAIRNSFSVSELIAPTSKTPSDLLSDFQTTTEIEVLNTVKSYSIKCSPDDPISAVLLTKNIDLFVPVWNDLVNLSFSTGSMDCLKSAVVTPLLKELD